MKVVKTTPDDEALRLRRSPHYRPSLWDHHDLLSLHTNTFAIEESKVEERAAFLKERVRKMLVKPEGSLEQLEFIDTLQRLGVSYHFESEIDTILSKTYGKGTKSAWKTGNIEDLHATALEFRLLRQHGFNVPQDVFDFMKTKKEGAFRRGLKEDIKGLLSLYEASYLSTKDEAKMKEARAYANEGLREFVTRSRSINKMVEGDIYYMKEMVMHALEMPYHWRMGRLEARWYLDNMTHGINPLLLEFAKLDFNIAQVVHQHELKYLSSWWSNTGLTKQLQFVRDRVTESYFSSVGTICEPQFRYHRQMLTKIFVLITTIDDVYDIYGTIEELELFTRAVEKWDVNHLEELPEYMRYCFLVLYNEINLIGYDVLRDKKFNVIPYLKRAWTDMCKTFLTEAKWCKSGYKPSLEEYMQNGWISSSVPTILIHLFCAISDNLSENVFDKLFDHHQQRSIFRCPATILRLANDLGTSSEEVARGDVMKSIQCHMHETGASEAEAREHVRGMIVGAWEDLNYHKTARSSSSSSLPRGFVGAAADLGRVAQCVYQYGDGIGRPDKAKAVQRIRSLLFNPVPLF